MEVSQLNLFIGRVHWKLPHVQLSLNKFEKCTSHRITHSCFSVLCRFPIVHHVISNTSHLVVIFISITFTPPITPVSCSINTSLTHSVRILKIPSPIQISTKKNRYAGAQLNWKVNFHHFHKTKSSMITCHRHSLTDKRIKNSLKISINISTKGQLSRVSN